ncbi:hypothetical protein ACHAXR_005798 [Thalassiosira sp. AJA248-18]
MTGDLERRGNRELTMMMMSYLPLILSIAVLPIAGRAFSSRNQFMAPRGPSCLHETSASAVNAALGKPLCTYQTITIQPSGMNEGELPRQAVSVEDLTPDLKSFLERSGMQNGVINVISRHTTTAITINERESRLAQDVEDFFLKACPPDERSSSEKRVEGVRYLHNDIGERPDGDEEAQRCRDNGWDIDDSEELQKWRNQEPINAHSHLISMMLGSSESIPVVDGEMVIGQWQSVLMVDLDGPRTRTVGVQLMGYA